MQGSAAAAAPSVAKNPFPGAPGCRIMSDAAAKEPSPMPLCTASYSCCTGLQLGSYCSRGDNVISKTCTKQTLWPGICTQSVGAQLHGETNSTGTSPCYRHQGALVEATAGSVLDVRETQAIKRTVYCWLMAKQAYQPCNNSMMISNAQLSQTNSSFHN